MDGYVVLGTKLDTKSFDAQINYIESQLQEIEHKLKQADMGFEVGDTVKLEAQYEKLSQKLSVLKQKKEDLNKTDLSNVQKSIDNIGKSTSNTIKHAFFEPIEIPYPFSNCRFCCRKTLPKHLNYLTLYNTLFSELLQERG